MNQQVIQNVIQAVLLAAILGAYGFAWSVNTRLTTLENTTDEGHARSHFLVECKLQIAPECRAEATPDTD